MTTAAPSAGDTADNDLVDFARGLIADVRATADAEGGLMPLVFTRKVLDDLEEAGVTSNTFVAHHSGHGHEVHGYSVSESGESLDLFSTDFDLMPLDSRIGRVEVATRFRRLLTFLARTRDGLRQEVEESFDVYDMCASIEKALPEVRRIRLFVLSNRVATSIDFATSMFDDLPVSHEVWDLSRLHRHATSGSLGEPIVVTFDPPLPCVNAPSTEEDHSVVLTVIPGQYLANLYGDYGTRLLELNVRSFLQARGSVNKGIRDTILHRPGRFLAYNNGITATASQVDLARAPDGTVTGIERIHGLQIVNGGQTTASLHYAHVRDKADLSQISVQMKLTQVHPDRLSEIVPRISEYSNTQNRVTLVDFSSNHEYHVAIQRITRSLWAPPADGGNQETHWFYERARGQYTDELAKARTPARRRRFKELNPTKQKFSKSDLAKFVHSWNQLPFHVARGAQKNFSEFMVRIEKNPPVVDVQYCRRIIAMAILFKVTDRIAARHGAGSYKSFVTTYTVARLSLATDRRVDLDRIWREQALTPALVDAITDLCPSVMRVVTRPPGGGHAGEWAKKPACWDAVSRIPWTVPESLAAELRDTPLDEAELARGAATDESVRQEVASVPAAEWLAIEQWARETRSLEPWQRQLLQAVGRRLAAGETPSENQAVQALEVRRAALESGFVSDLSAG